MPVLINEVVAEVEPAVVPASQAEPDEQRVPLTATELEMVELLAIIEQRRERLTVD
jgi:hypothetical protein